MKNNDKIKNITRSWYGSRAQDNLGNQLLEFYLTDAATIAFRYYDIECASILMKEVAIPVFELRWSVSMFHLLNS